MKPKIAVTNTETALSANAKNLAKRLLLPYIESHEKRNFDFILTLATDGLRLEDMGINSLGTLKIDFLQGKIAYRLRHLHHQKQLLAKAIGWKINSPPTVLDTTAGLGYDSLVLAQLGCAVILLERSPIIFSLLQDALERGLKPTGFPPQIKLMQVDAIDYLQQNIPTKEKPDIIYLDPMYPPLSKSASAKKEIRFLRKLIGDDTDANMLLNLALIHAKKRVVLKRHRLAPYLADSKPNYSLCGKQHRLDVYLTKS